MTFRQVVVSLRGPGEPPVLPFACCVGHCVLLAAVACVPAGVVFVLAYWGCAGCCGDRFSTFAARSPPHSGRPPPRCVSVGMWSVGLLFLHGALDSHPLFSSRAASGRCVLTAAAACACAGVSASAEPRSWHTGSVLVGAGVVLQCLLPTPLACRRGPVTTRGTHPKNDTPSAGKGWVGVTTPPPPPRTFKALIPPPHPAEGTAHRGHKWATGNPASTHPPVTGPGAV